MVAQNAVTVSGCKRCNIWVTRRCQVFWFDQGIFKQISVPQTLAAAVLSQLHVVNGDQYGAVNPAPSRHLASSRSTALSHDLAPQAHLIFKFWVVCCDAQAVRRFSDIKIVTFFKPHLSQQVFEKDSPKRITNLCQLQHVHDATLLSEI